MLQISNLLFGVLSIGVYILFPHPPIKGITCSFKEKWGTFSLLGCNILELKVENKLLDH